MNPERMEKPWLVGKTESNASIPGRLAFTRRVTPTLGFPDPLLPAGTRLQHRCAAAWLGSSGREGATVGRPRARGRAPPPRASSGRAREGRAGPRASVCAQVDRTHSQLWNVIFQHSQQHYLCVFTSHEQEPAWHIHKCLHQQRERCLRCWNAPLGAIFFPHGGV